MALILLGQPWVWLLQAMQFDKGNEALGSFRELRFFGPALLNLALQLVAVEGLRRVRTKHAVAWFSRLTSGVSFGRLRRGAGAPWWR